MAYIVMAFMDMAFMVMDYIAMAFIVMAGTVMALYTYGLCSYGLYCYGNRLPSQHQSAAPPVHAYVRASVRAWMLACACVRSYGSIYLRPMQLWPKELRPI